MAGGERSRDGRRRARRGRTRQIGGFPAIRRRRTCRGQRNGGVQLRQGVGSAGRPLAGTGVGSPANRLPESGDGEAMAAGVSVRRQAARRRAEGGDARAAREGVGSAGGPRGGAQGAESRGRRKALDFSDRKRRALACASDLRAGVRGQGPARPGRPRRKNPAGKILRKIGGIAKNPPKIGGARIAQSEAKRNPDSVALYRKDSEGKCCTIRKGNEGQCGTIPEG